jgi:hypothetical protein
MQPIGNRPQLITAAVLKAALGAACWSLPISLVASLYCWWVIDDPNLRTQQIVHLLVYINLCWIGVAAMGHALKAREGTLTPEQLQFVHGRIRRAALEACLFAVPVVVFFVLGTWGYGALGAIGGGAFLAAIWLGCAGLVGRMQAMKQIEAEERQQQTIAALVATMDSMPPEPRESSPQVQRTLPGPITKYPTEDNPPE